MPSICFYFQVHQPYRLKPYRINSVGRDHDYFDHSANAAILRKVADKCYLPANRKMLDLIRRFDGAFRISYSITGSAIEQMQRFAPEVLTSFQELARTGAVEFLAETYHHSLAATFDAAEFQAQVEQHTSLMQQCFGVKPRVFRNTELIFDDRIADLVKGLGFAAILAEGADDVLGWRSPNFVYRSPIGPKLLLKNYQLSDDIAFRFSNRNWKDFPLTADKFADWVHAVDGSGDVINLFMDYETFGEHQWEDTGIFNFLDHLPHKVMARSQWGFHTPSEVIERYPVIGDVAFHRTVSWADIERDLSAWRGNPMQDLALSRIYALTNDVKRRNDPALTEIWRRLQTSDHFYYMCTKWFADGDVHAYFSPYESPYEGFINYMNAIEDFQSVISDVKDARYRAVG
jgi:alpha-amylase